MAEDKAPALLHELLDRIWYEHGSHSYGEWRLWRSMGMGNERFGAQSGNVRIISPALQWDSEIKEEVASDNEWAVYDRPPPESIWQQREK